MLSLLAVAETVVKTEYAYTAKTESEAKTLGLVLVVTNRCNSDTLDFQWLDEIQLRPQPQP